MENEHVPLLSANKDTFEEGKEHTQPIGAPQPAASAQTAVAATNAAQSSSQPLSSASNAQQGNTTDKAATSKAQPVEGYLAKCGECGKPVMFPLGCSRSDCASCGAINYMASNMVPNVTRKALLVCPMCKASILYTIGCTHFQCSCGAVLEIPIPKYYIPCFGERK